MKKSLLFLFICAPFFSIAQNEGDALRYSWINFGGSARFASMAGSMGALGADPSVAAVNPAGYARFTRSDFSLGFNYAEIQSASTFNGTSSNDGKSNFNLSSFSLIGAFPVPNSSDWKSIQFGVSYQRYANFHNKISIEGSNSSSLLDAFVEEANGIPEENLLDQRPFYSGLAYWAYLIDPLDTNQNTYSSQIPDGNVNQLRTITRTGSMGETNFTLSGNYLDKLYFGGSLGLPGVRYSEIYMHEESPKDSSLALRSFSFKESLVTRGLGINFKAGVIFTPVQWLRLGLALHTPTGIGLSDRWSTTASSDFKTGPDYTETSVLGNYNYRLRTPGRTVFSLGLILKKRGSLNIDYERVNYAKAKLRSDRYDPTGYSFTYENQAITNSYRSVSNLRIGTEWRIKPFYLRAGFALYGKPFKNNISISDPTRITYSGGIGYRNKKYYIDLAYLQTSWTEDYYMYNSTITEAATVRTSIHSILISGGINF